MAQATEDDRSELLLSCRYGDLDDIQNFVSQFGQDAVNQVRDDNGNTVLHMAAGNGHEDVLDYLLSSIPPSSIAIQNNAGSTALHWAALNSHLPIMKKLIQVPDGPGIDLIDIKNAAGRSPLAEAEMVGWDEGAAWLVQMMNLDTERVENADEASAEDEIGVTESMDDIQVEIEDADGGIARMTISDRSQPPAQLPSS